MIFENVDTNEFTNYIIINKATIKKTCEYFNITEYKYRKIKKFIQDNDYNNYILIQSIAENNKNNVIQSFKEIPKTFISENVIKSEEIIKDGIALFEILNKYDNNILSNLAKSESVLNQVEQVLLHNLEQDVDCCYHLEKIKNTRNDRRKVKDSFNICQSMLGISSSKAFKKLNAEVNAVRKDNRKYSIKLHKFEVKEYLDSL